MMRSRRQASSSQVRGASWSEFASKINGRKGWDFSPSSSASGSASGGTVFYRTKDLVCRVRIALPTNVLLPERKREELVERNLPVDFEVLCSSKNGYNDHKTLAALDFEFSKLWRAGCCPRTAFVPPYTVEKPPPPRLRRLVSLEAGPTGEGPDLEAYHATRISKTPLGILWGQDALAIGLPDEDKTGEVGKPHSVACPFCEEKPERGVPERGVPGGSYTRVFTIEGAELDYLGSVTGEPTSVLGCTGCGRVVEVATPTGGEGFEGEA